MVEIRALSPTSTRACYGGVVEHSVYVSADTRGLALVER